MPGTAEIAISIALKWVCDQHFQLVGGQLSVEIIESKQPLNGTHDFNKSSMPIQNYEQLLDTVVALLLVSFRPFSQFTGWMCADIGIVVFTDAYEFFGTVEKWHSDIPWMVNACWPLKTRDVGYAFSLWLTTANQNFLASCLFTTSIDPLVLFPCTLLCAFLLRLSIELFTVKETKGSRTL